MTNIEDIKNEIASQRGDIKELTQSINLLAQAIARKEERDHHTQEEVKDIKGRVDNHAARILSLEKVSAGDEALRKIFYAAITVVTGAIIFGALYSFFISKGIT